MSADSRHPHTFTLRCAHVMHYSAMFAASALLTSMHPLRVPNVVLAWCHRYENFPFASSEERERFFRNANRIVVDQTRPRPSRFLALFELCRTVSNPVTATAHMLQIHQYATSFSKDGFLGYIRRVVSGMDLDGNLPELDQAYVGFQHTALMLKGLLDTYNKYLTGVDPQLRLTPVQALAITDVDHVLPVASGGGDALGNLMFLPRLGSGRKEKLLGKNWWEFPIFLWHIFLSIQRLLSAPTAAPSCSSSQYQQHYYAAQSNHHIFQSQLSFSAPRRRAKLDTQAANLLQTFLQTDGLVATAREYLAIPSDMGRGAWLKQQLRAGRAGL